MQTLADFLYWAEQLFSTHKVMFGHGTDNAWDEAVALARHVLNLRPDVDKSILSRKLSSDETTKLTELALRRVNEHIPVPYLINEAWFCGEKYYVDQRVIIPRSPFAELINNSFQGMVQNEHVQNILDLCTGSGCIAIACANAFPHAKVDAVDISLAALEVAIYNINQHRVSDRVCPIYSDLFQNIIGKKYDLIVSNPPYVSSKEYCKLAAEYHHEPELALTSGIDGLDCTKVILHQAYNFLSPQGKLFVEVGNSWRSLVKQYPNIPFTWLSLQHGGDGIFMLTKENLPR